MTAFATTLTTLENLAQPKTDDFRPVISVMGDIGRGLPTAPDHELFDVLSHIALVREMLERAGYADGVLARPAQILAEGVKSEPFCAGGLWAAADIVQAQLRARQHNRRRRRTAAKREDLRKLALELLEEVDAIAPKQLVRAAQEREIDAKASDASRAISDLVEEGWLAEISSDESSDRRFRFYRRLDAEEARAAAERAHARYLVETLIDQVGEERLEDALNPALERYGLVVQAGT